MAIITLSRQVAAFGDEIGMEVEKKLGYKFIKRTDIEKRIVELGFPESKMPKYDERKPGFFASMAKDRDLYINLCQYAMLESAKDNNSIFIGRGAFAQFKNVINHVSVRFIANEETRIERLMKEFNWNEKQAKQRISESDQNRKGFHMNFYNVNVDDPQNFHMILNTSLIDIKKCAGIISDYVTQQIKDTDEKKGMLQINNIFKAQQIVIKLIQEQNVRIEFMHAEIQDNTFILYGVSDSVAAVEKALTFIKKEIPGYEIKSSVSVVQNFKTYQ